jgi:lipopolysaccharide export system protein LptA
MSRIASSSTPRLRALGLAALLAALAAGPAWGDKADRNQNINISADSQSTLDLLKQVVEFNGNVVITQGTLTIHADRVELRQSPEGFHSASATGHPATFSQKREGLNETIQGQADRVDYDGRADTVHFIGHAVVRRMRGGAMADEITGNEISYDNVTEVFAVAGGPSNVSPANPTGRVRAVLSPPPQQDANKPADKTPPAALKPSTSLGDRK